jgi:hypothetical protein
VNDNRKHNEKKSAGQGADVAAPEPLKIGASTPFDFSARNLTAYGGLLPVATMLEKLGFEQLVENALTIRRLTRAMPVYRFVLAMVLALYVGFSRLNHLRFLEREPMLTGILKVLRLPPQCTFWRFLASLHLSVAGQILQVQQTMRQRVLGCRARGSEDDHAGHRHHGAYTVRPSDGRAQELQPEKQGQEELPADSDVSGRDAGIRRGRVAQWRPAHRQTDRPPSGRRVRHRAEGRGDDLCAGRFRVLLRRIGGGV